jgi:hypothetical protein
VKVRVRSEAGRAVWAVAYKMGGKYGDAEPSAGYVLRIREGYRDRGMDVRSHRGKSHIQSQMLPERRGHQ